MAISDKSTTNPSQNWLKKSFIALPALWLGLFLLIPLLLILKMSFAEAILAQPPFTALFVWGEGFFPRLNVSFYSYELLIEDSYYFDALLQSVTLASIATITTLLIALPMCLAIIKVKTHWQNILLILVILPFWTSFLIRVYSWKILLRNDGLINQVLLYFGFIDAPLPMLYSNFAVLIGIIYSYLPFMILPIYAGLKKLDWALVEAATDLGAKPLTIFFKIILPLMLPSIIAGIILVFIPATGEFVIPDLLGGSDSLLIGKLIWTEFFNNRDWPTASAIALVLLILFFIPLLILNHFGKHNKLEDML